MARDRPDHEVPDLRRAGEVLERPSHRLRIRGILGNEENVSERKMFGGVGIVGTDLMVRVGKKAFEKAVKGVLR